MSKYKKELVVLAGGHDRLQAPPNPFLAKTMGQLEV